VEDDSDENEENEDNDDKQKLAAKGDDINEEEEEDDDDGKDNNVVDDNPRCSLPNCTHHDLNDLYDVASKQTDQAPFTKADVWEVAASQPSQHLKVLKLWLCIMVLVSTSMHQTCHCTT